MPDYLLLLSLSLLKETLDTSLRPYRGFTMTAISYRGEIFSHGVIHGKGHLNILFVVLLIRAFF